MILLKLTFMDDGSLEIFNPETRESMTVDQNQRFQLYDSIQLDYYKEDVRDHFNGTLDPELAAALVVDSEFVTQTAVAYQSALRKSQTICEAEHEHLEDTVQEAVDKCNGSGITMFHNRFRY